MALKKVTGVRKKHLVNVSIFTVYRKFNSMNKGNPKSVWNNGQSPKLIFVSVE